MKRNIICVFFFLLGLMILALCNCEKNEIRQDDFDPESIQFNNPNDRYLSYAPLKKLEKENFHFYYIGEVKDSINLKYTKEFSKVAYANDTYKFRRNSINNYRFANSNDIKIVIDANRVIRTPVDNYKAYPVIAKNISKDTLRFEFDLEFKSKTEEWNSSHWREPIKNILTCGIPQPTYLILPPNHILVTGININKGGVQTKMRIRCSADISNEIFGRVTFEDFELTEDDTNEEILEPYN